MLFGKLGRAVLASACLSLTCIPYGMAEDKPFISLASPFVKVNSGKGDTFEGWGSGTYIGNGYFLTADHIVDGENNFQIVTDTGLKLKAKVAFTNHVYDFAVLHIDNFNDKALMYPVPMNCNVQYVGTHVRLYGNPASNDEPNGIEFVYTQGEIVGKIRKYADWPEVYPVDATIVWGQSGGGAVDDQGELVGINVAMLIANNAAMAFSFVVPVTLACNALDFYHIDLK